MTAKKNNKTAQPQQQEHTARPEMLWFLAGAAFFLRLITLGRHELWLDEANSVIIAQGSLLSVLHNVVNDANPPLYYFLLHGWISVFGTAEYALRMLSVLCGTGLVIALFYAGKRYINSSAGLVAALLCAVSPIQIYYSQNVRMYTLLPLLALSSVFFLIESLEQNKAKYWAGYSIAAALTCYTHNYGLFLLPLGPVLVLLFKEYRQRMKPLALSLAGAVLLYLPWAFVIARQSAPERTNWIVQFMEPISPLLFIPGTLQVFSAGAGYPYYFKYLQFGSSGFISFTAIVLYLFLLYRSLFLKTENYTVRRKTLVFAAALFVPLLCAFFVSLVKSVYLIGRYDSIAFPAYCLVIAAGVSSLHSRGARNLIMAALVFLALFSISPYYGAQKRGDSRDVIEHIAQNSRDGDAVIFTGFRRATMQYYFERIGNKPALQLFSFPLAVEKHQGIYDAKTYLADPLLLDADAKNIVDKLSGGGRVWVADDPVSAGVNNYLFKRLDHFSIVKEHSSRAAQIICFQVNKP